MTQVISTNDSPAANSPSVGCIVLLFAAFSFAGWLYETIDNVFAFGGLYLRAQLMLPWCPIYGIGGLIIVSAMEPVRRCLGGRVPLVLQVALLAVCIYALSAAIELAGSYVCEAMMGYVPWDYTHSWGHFQGRIAPAYTARFVVLGLVALYMVLPAITRFSAKHPKTANRIAVILIALFIGDYALQSAGIWDGVKESLTIFGVQHW